jgi:hypothetical protein
MTNGFEVETIVAKNFHFVGPLGFMAIEKGKSYVICNRDRDMIIVKNPSRLEPNGYFGWVYEKEF